MELIEIGLGGTPNVLGIVAYHLGIVGILGVEVQMNLLVVVEGRDFALIEAEGRIVGITKGIFIGGNGDKFVIAQMGEVKQTLMLCISDSGVAARFVGLLDLFGGLLAIGEGRMAVHIYFVKLTALRQKILFHGQKPPLTIFYIITIGASVVNLSSWTAFVQPDEIFVEYCKRGTLASAGRVWYNKENSSKECLRCIG